MSNFVQIQQGNFRALVRPENLAKVEDKLNRRFIQSVSHRR